jgi:hypothetical protein
MASIFSPNRKGEPLDFFSTLIVRLMILFLKGKFKLLKRKKMLLQGNFNSVCMAASR